MKYKILTLVFISLFMLTGFIQPAAFAGTFNIKIEDPALEKAIRDELKLDAGAALDFTALQKLTSLYPKGQEKIKSLKGLEMAFNLQSLFLPNQEISDVSPLGGLYKLTFLALNHNRIQNACPLGNLFQLHKLVISDNQIEDISCFSRLTGLTDLLASNNKIQSIAPLAKLKLGWLDVAKNPVADLAPVGSMKKLHHIFVDQDTLNDPSKLLQEKLGQSGVAVNRASAASDGISGISVLVNNDRVLFDRAPVVEEGTTLVQFRPLFEKLGFVIHWDESTRTIQAEKDHVQISLQVDNPSASLNGTPYTLPVAPKVVDGNVFVPIRFVAEASKYDVTWESQTKTIYLMPVHTVISPDGRSKLTVGGKWLSKTPPSSTAFQIYVENGNNSILSMTDSKARIGKAMTIEDYEAAVKKAMEPQNIAEYSADQTMKINGMEARQFSYTVTGKNGVNFTVIQTLIEGKYSYFRVILLTGDPVFSEVNQDYQNIVQTFEEIKTDDELSKEKFGAMKPAERLLDAAHYYRGLGFFDRDKGLTDQQFDDKFLGFYKGFVTKDWDPFDSSEYYDEFAELYVLQQDQDRVWLKDTEADVGKGNDVYVATLEKWSWISRGAFQPTDITETWGSEEGPVTVSFTLNGQKKVLHPQYMNDFIDTGILAEINEMIKESGYQFEAVEIDQQVFVTVLTAEEKSKIRKDRYLPFVSYN
ncbi:hypothetical protein SD70_14135 [Gordoniibacillus kamchatkensis]|uniref:Copper amine oxidase-like N-terminal domain-containing protein n=1 Tax=Gordoniibacillus kamchatkensis TaxID=1590651 RepID=A0ABR5AHC3_9BACL|nr:stalk domain-containing protein [Paenibacillus sp. VKM B-2647]KIL40371.1 hypothetical protein SD70_14135 [Paenibacillus sp. VKM B-2647]